MGNKGYYGDEVTTSKGKVVYARKIHFFKAKSIDKIITKYNNRTKISEARASDEAIKIRSIFKIASSIYSMVDDMFDIPGGVLDEEYYTIKTIWREGNDHVIDVIANWIGYETNNIPLSHIVSIVGKMINRGMEYLLTGSTQF